MKTRNCIVTGFAGALLSATLPSALAVSPAGKEKAPPVLGRWDLTIHAKNGDYPSWLEVTAGEGGALKGRFVGQFGSAFPIPVFWRNDKLLIGMGENWTPEKGGPHSEAQVKGGKLVGKMEGRNGSVEWTGVRVPVLKRKGEPKWGAPIELINGKDLEGWKPRHADAPNRWTIKDGILTNTAGGSDLMTTRTFTDFKIHAEFRYPKGSNSGLYLRGRYEVQIEDNYGQEPESHRIAGVYGFLTPSSNPAKPAGEWQTFDVTLVGRKVTVVFNGEKVIDGQEIPGITGGAIDSNEGAPGPIFIQGDHGPIEFRKLTLTPAK